MALNIFGTQSLKLKFDGGYQDELFFTQADSGRVLQVQVLDENNQVIYAEGLTLEFYIGNATEVTKVTGTLEDAEEGIFLVKLEDTQLTYSGMYKSQFVLKNRAGERLGSKQITTRVEGSIENGETLGLNALVTFEDVQRITDLLTEYDTNLEEGIAVNEALKANSAEATRLNRAIVTAIEQANITNNAIQSAVDLVTQSLGSIDAKTVEIAAISDRLDTLNADAGVLESSLSSLISSSETAKSNLDGSISSAGSVNSTLREAIQQGSNLNTQLAGLNNAIQEATQIETDLSESITQAQTISETLGTSQSNAQTLIDTLNGLNTVADTKVTNINTAIGNANTAETNLNDARIQAEAAEDALNEIIATGNLDDYITVPRLTSELVNYLSKTEATEQYATKTELANIDLTEELENLATKAELANKADKTDFNEVKNKVDGIEDGANKTVINNSLASTSTTEALSANQGRTLNQNLLNAKTLDKTLEVYSYGLDLDNAPKGIVYLTRDGNYSNHPFPDFGTGVTNKEAYLYTSPELNAAHLTTKIQIITSIEGKQQLRSGVDGVWSDWTELSPSKATQTQDGLLSKEDFTKLAGIEAGAQKNNVTSIDIANWNNKVDKVSGKQLSTNDYTTVEKNKLAGIQAGAQVNAVSSVNGQTGAVTTPNTTYDVATTNTDGLMSSADKVKLDGVEAGSQKNTVTSVQGRTGAVTISKSDVGLGDVNNVAITAAQVTKINELNYTRALTQTQYNALSTSEKNRSDVWYGIYEG